MLHSGETWPVNNSDDDDDKCAQLRHYGGGGPPRVTPEGKNFFVGKFTKNSGETR